MEADDERRPRRAGVGIWGGLTALFGVLTLTMCVWYTLILVNPYSPVNPLPPATVTPYPGLQGGTPAVNGEASPTAAAPGELPTTASGDPASATPPVAEATIPQTGGASPTPNATAPAAAGAPTATVDIPALRSPSPTAGTAGESGTPGGSGTAYPGSRNPYPAP